MAGSAVDVDVSLEGESCLSVQAIAIDAKSNNDWIKSCKKGSKERDYTAGLVYNINTVAYAHECLLWVIIYRRK